jgi:hypothetical protein
VNNPEAVAWLEGEGMDPGRAADSGTPHPLELSAASLLEWIERRLDEFETDRIRPVNMPPPPHIDPIEGYGTGEIRGILGGIRGS